MCIDLTADLADLSRTLSRDTTAQERNPRNHRRQNQGGNRGFKSKRARQDSQTTRETQTLLLTLNFVSRGRPALETDNDTENFDLKTGGETSTLQLHEGGDGACPDLGFGRISTVTRARSEVIPTFPKHAANFRWWKQPGYGHQDIRSIESWGQACVGDAREGANKASARTGPRDRLGGAPGRGVEGEGRRCHQNRSSECAHSIGTPTSCSRDLHTTEQMHAEGGISGVETFGEIETETVERKVGLRRQP